METPLRLSRNMLHGWKDNSVLAKPLAACTHLHGAVLWLPRVVCLCFNFRFYAVFRDALL